MRLSLMDRRSRLYHSVTYLGLDPAIGTPVNVGLDHSGSPANHTNDQKVWFLKRYTSPPDQPIFQEAIPNPLGLNFTISSEYLHSSYFNLTTIVQTPGFAATEYWTINCTSGLLKLYGPNDPNWMPLARQGVPATRV